MEHNALAIGLPNKVLAELKDRIFRYHYRLHFTESFTVREAGRLLGQQTFHLLIADLDYLRSMQQSDWLARIRKISFVSIIILSDTPEEDITSMVQLGVEVSAC